MAIGITVFLAISCNMVRFWEFRIETNNSSVMTFEILLANNSQYNLWYVIIGSQLVIYIIPLIVLITFNFLISIQLKEAVKKRIQMSKDHTADRRTAKMMSAVISGKFHFYTICLWFIYCNIDALCYCLFACCCVNIGMAC